MATEVRCRIFIIATLVKHLYERHNCLSRHLPPSFPPPSTLITWSLVSTLAPARLLGLTGGTFNLIGNLAAIATPIVIGFLASGDSFAPAITYIAVLALLGALSYILLVGKVERIELS
jgi:hypothetical protein